jgi:hypothetical protein
MTSAQLADIRNGYAVGDGATTVHFSDRRAWTVVARTTQTLKLRRDIATRDGWRPDMAIGGFSAVCRNNEDQRYTYAPDPHGETTTAWWSAKLAGFYAAGARVIPGRHERYDYNF